MIPKFPLLLLVTLLQRREAMPSPVRSGWPWFQRALNGPLAFGRATIVPRRFHTRPCISLISANNHSISVGKYLVSALSKRLDEGGYRASVSIRSGRGSASTDRVMRFTPHFDSESAAHQYAHAQGLIWVAQTHPATAALAQ